MTKSFLRAAATALMVGASMAMPPIGQRYTPTFERVVEYDGLGRKVKPKVHPSHNAKHRTRAWRDYARRVVATHSTRPDPRHNKYLHSHARQMRALVNAIMAAA